jgi:hypothetical protein
MSTTAAKSLPNLRPAPFLTSGQLSRETGLPQSRIQELVAEGLPSYQLDQRRYVYDRDEAIAWLTEHGYVIDAYRAAIKRLVDAAPPLTAEQADRIKAVLGAVRHENCRRANEAPSQPLPCRRCGDALRFRAMIPDRH